MPISSPPSRMDTNIRFQDQENAKPPKQEEEDEQEEEEALSLSDLPLDSDEPDNSKTRDHHSRRSASQPSDIFEFFNVNLASNDNLSMSHAEDIIYRGKLVPYAYNNTNKSLFDEQILESYHEDALSLSRRYCDSLPTRSNNNSTRLASWSSRSLDRGESKLRRNSSLVMKTEASETRRTFSKGYNSSKPRWYNLMFGSVKVPREMDLRDMKSRQVRRSPGSMFAAAMEGGGGDRRSSSWGHGLMRVLSCKNHASVDVMASSSIGLVPQV